MPTKTLKLTFASRKELNEILEKVRAMETEAVRWLIRNKKTALKSVHAALYHPLRERYPELHSHWVKSALKTATGIVHQFNKRKRKGKAKRPHLKKPFVSLSPELYKVNWNGMWLKVTISKSAHDLEPIVLWFKPHSKYKEVLDRWRKGEGKLGQLTLTPTSISLPFKFPEVPAYQPVSLIAIDSNENSLDYLNTATGELGSVDVSKVARVNRDYDRRIRRATKGKNNPKAKRKIQRKYGRLRRERTKTLWCATALFFIRMAVAQQAALVLENLKGMKLGISLRKASKRMRRRLLNHWSIMAFHRILAAKAKENGVPIVFVDPKGTSKTCPRCGGSLRGQDKECPSCGLSRHYVAAINIACRGAEQFPAGVLSAGQGVIDAPRCLSSGGKVEWSAVRRHDGKLPLKFWG